MKRLVVEMNHSRAGFFVYLEFVINAILYCESESSGAEYCLPPKVRFGERSLDGGLNHYYEAAHGTNSFDYFFSLKQEPSVDGVYEERRDSDFFWKLHEEVGIQCYPHGRFDTLKLDYDEPYTREIDAWYQENRRRASDVLERHIEIRSEVVAQVEREWCSHFAPGEAVIGCHIRGTDKIACVGGRKIQPEEYFPYLDRLVDTRDSRIFVATDDPGYLGTMLERYGDRLAHTSVARDPRNVFIADEGGGYQKGLDVLLDCLMLSRCDFLLKCSSAVSEFAVFFNPALHANNLNLQYDCSHFLYGSASGALVATGALEHNGREPERRTMAPNRSTLVVHHADQHWNRALTAELGCIFVAYAYAQVRGFDFALDTSKHPFLFSHGYERFLVPRWKRDVDPSAYDQVLASSFRGPLDAKVSTIDTWDMLDFLLKEVPAVVLRHLYTSLLVLQPEVERRYLQDFLSLGIEGEYAAIHIRRGDKIAEATQTGKRHEASEYLEPILANRSDISDVFVCGDDFRAVQEFDEEIRQRRLGMRVRSLVDPRSSGFDWQGMLARGEVMSIQDMEALLVDLMICANSDVFVGTGSSAVFRFICNVHRDDSQCLDVGW